MRKTSECPECDSHNLFVSSISAGGGYAPNYLNDLGSFWAAPKFDVVVCQDCGLTRFYAPEHARQKLSASKKWSRLV